MVVLRWVCSCGQRHDVDEASARRERAGLPPLPPPAAGDLMLCVGCGEPHAFQENAAPVVLPWSVCAQVLVAAGAADRLASFTRARAIIRSMN